MFYLLFSYFFMWLPTWKNNMFNSLRGPFWHNVAPRLRFFCLLWKKFLWLPRDIIKSICLICFVLWFLKSKIDSDQVFLRKFTEKKSESNFFCFIPYSIGIKYYVIVYGGGSKLGHISFLHHFRKINWKNWVYKGI